jgi:hypothetical protein
MFGSFAQELRTQLGDVYYDINMYKGQYDGTIGSPYLNESFIPCQINEIRETQLVRFNAYNGTVEVKVSSTKTVLLSDSEIFVIVLKDGSGKTYHTGNFFNPKGNLVNSFFEVIHQSTDYRLFIKENIKYHKKVKAEGYKDAQPPSFKKAAASYFITDLWEKTPRLVMLPRKMSAFLELFPDQSKALKKFIREKRLKIDNAEDLVQIMNQALELN